MIKVENLSFYRKDKKVIDDLTLSINTGEITSIVGPNGAGKTTLTYLISGLFRDYIGDIYVNENNIKSFKIKKLATIRAILPQFSTLSLPFKVYDVVMMGRNPYNNYESKHLDHHIVIEAMEKANVSHLADRIFTELSGGEKQRVQFAKALAQIEADNSKEKKYLILDEPTSSLDPGESRRLMSILQGLVNVNLAVILVAHDLNIASEYSQKIIMLKNGQLFRFGNTKEFLNLETLNELYETKLRIAESSQKDFKIIY